MDVLTIGEVLAGAPLREPLDSSLAARSVAGLAYDSRKVSSNFLYFAFPGSRTDGRNYSEQAFRSGAAAVVCDLPPLAPPSGPWIEVTHGRQALAIAARNAYQDANRRLTRIGITGTNGKTTTSYLIDSILRAAGIVTGLIGTVEYRLAGRVLPAVNTTPESLDLYEFFAALVQAGGTHLTMEVSSHALALGRVYGVAYDTAVFTNLTRDHLDFHKTMENYFQAKRLLFTGSGAPAPRAAVVNFDDEWHSRIAPPSATSVLTYGYGEGADLRAQNVGMSFRGLEFDLVREGNARRISSPLVGRINVYNILAAYGAGLSLGLAPDTIENGIAQCRAVPGRFERVEAGQPFLVVVDYAHTDDALRNTIQVARGLTKGRIITLFGCGGDRDRTKRPLMGSAAAEFSDIVVLTSDNPRSEDPLAIMNDALVGINRHDVPLITEPDRTQAIRQAIGAARAGDVVILAGKGHETYQVLRDRVIAFDDREVARRVLRELGYEEQSQ